jgi:hypothetical protein
MIAILKSIISCDVLGLEESFQGTCFGHVFFEVCEYATMDEFFCKGLRNVFIKAAQGDL